MEQPQIIFMRDDGDEGVELTSRDDPAMVAYIRADCIDIASITENKYSYYSPGGEYDDTMVDKCCDCRHNQQDENEWPCFACKHLGG